MGDRIGQTPTVGASYAAIEQGRVDLAASTGLRWGELAGLRADAVDTRHGVIIVATVSNGTGRDGTALPEDRRVDPGRSRPGAAPAARQETKLAAKGLMFSGPHGGVLSDRNVNRRHLAPACRRAGVTEEVTGSIPEIAHQHHS